MQIVIFVLESHQIYSGRVGICRKLTVYQESLWASNEHDHELPTFLNVLGVWKNKCIDKAK